MRGDDQKQTAMFSYLTLAQRIPADHPLRRIRAIFGWYAEGLVDALRGTVRTAGAAFDSAREAAAGAVAADSVCHPQRAAANGADELQPAVSLVCGFEPGRCGMGHDGVYEKPGVADAQGKIAQRLLEAVLEQARARDLLSEEHFTVGGTLLEAWASRRSFVPKDSPPVGTGVGGKKLLPTRLDHRGSR